VTRRRDHVSFWTPRHGRDLTPTPEPTECGRCHIRFAYIEGFWHHDCGLPLPVWDHVLRVPGTVQPITGDAQLSRRQVASQLGVTPNTLWRWEKSNKSPVKPRKRKRDGGVVYSAGDVATLRAWARGDA
jgi:hypothetical protein